VRFITESFDFDEKIMDYRLSDRKKERLKWKDFSLQNLSDNFKNICLKPPQEAPCLLY
jgi:hypothetical protein